MDLKGGWKKDSPTQMFKNHILKIANNYHSAILILSTKKYKYGYSFLNPNFQEVWWGGPMASAYAYFHIPFELYRNNQLDEFHSVEHLDHWKCYDDLNKDYLNLGKEKMDRAQKIISRVQVEESRKSDEETSPIQLAQCYILLFWKQRLERDQAALARRSDLTGEERFNESTLIRHDLHALSRGWAYAQPMIEAHIQTLSP